MNDDDEIHLHARYASHLDMDRHSVPVMRIAIGAGLENAPIGVVTTPGTQNSKYVPAEQVVRFSQGSDFIVNREIPAVSGSPMS
jgi:hypothetical protein